MTSPRFPRFAIPILTSLLLGLGAASLTWGLACRHYGEPIRTLHLFGGYSIASVSEAIAVGSGLVLAALAPGLLRIGMHGVFRIYGILGIALGTAGIAWAIVAMARGEMVTVELLGGYEIRSAGAVLGAGCGVLVSAILALCLSGRPARTGSALDSIPDDEEY